jgi:hypothetical protein
MARHYLFFLCRPLRSGKPIGQLDHIVGPIQQVTLYIRGVSVSRCGDHSSRGGAATMKFRSTETRYQLLADDVPTLLTA